MLSVQKRSFLLLAICTFGLITSTLGQLRGFDLLGDQDKFSIPFEIDQGFMIVKIRMQKTFPMRFIFDTGAEHTIIFNKMYSDILKIPYDRRIPIIGSDLSREMYANIIRNIKMDMKGAASVKRDILVLEENYLRLFETAGIHVDGILGGEYFRGLIVEIDYNEQVITFYHPRVRSQINLTKYESFDIKVVNYKPYITATAISEKDTAEVKLLIDTGASLTFLIHSNSHPNLEVPDYVIPGHLGSGLGGDIIGYVGLMKRIKVGKYNFDNVYTSFQDIDDSVIRENEFFRNGLLGNVLLSRFKIVLDYTHSKLYLKPFKNYDKKFEYDKSGLTLYAYGPKLNSFYVKSIILDSPAYRAGLKPGDKILKICNRSHKRWSLEQITAILKKKEGTKIKLLIDREGQEIEFEFKLEDLLKKKKGKNTL